MGAVGILLAAGRGKRFDPGGIDNKLLQPLADGELVVEASARHMLAALPRVIAVVRPDDNAVAALLGRLGCEVRVCGDADTGMAASLTHAIDYVKGAPAWVVALGDMPFVQPSTIRALVAALGENVHIAAPVYRGQRGNPVAFGSFHLPLLLALDGDQGARAILKSHPVRDVDVDDTGILRDIDTRADLDL